MVAVFSKHRIGKILTYWHVYVVSPATQVPGGVFETIAGELPDGQEQAPVNVFTREQEEPLHMPPLVVIEYPPLPIEKKPPDPPEALRQTLDWQ